MFEQFMKPYGKEYCDYFYILGLFGLFSFFYAIGVLVLNLMTRKDTMNVVSNGVLLYCVALHCNCKCEGNYY